MLIRHPLIASIFPFVLAETSKPNSGDQTQGFTFSYPSSPGSNSAVIPITPSCPSPLVISGMTTSNNPLTADPVAPYTMVMLVHEQLIDGAGLRYERMYARSMDVGNMAASRSVENVWANGTQFIGCVWASNGVSGGCQDLITVSNSDQTAAAYANASSQCRLPSVMGSWVTPPASTLDVTVEHSAGLLASNGWPATCSDLRITPRNGTAPYTLLIAPAFHPPVKITSATRASMNYTIRLTHGQAFMLGVFDSKGNSFAFGPLHAGRADDLRCLAVATGQDLPAESKGVVGSGVLAGAVVAALLVGAAGAALVLWGCVIRKQKGRGREDRHELLYDESQSARPYTYRVESNQSYSNPKPLDPFVDSPHRAGPAFESPDTLYDPYVSGNGSGSSKLGYPRPRGTSFAVVSRESFGPELQRTESQDDPNMAIHTPSRNSRQPDPRHQSFPSASSGQRQHRFSASEIEPQRTPPALRLVGTPIPDASEVWDDGSDGEDYGDPYRSAGQKRGKDRPRSSQRPGSGETPGGDDSERTSRARKVYVVHSDGGGGDVHIQLPDGGARVIELPPGYRDETLVSGGREREAGARLRSGSNASPEAPPAPHFGPRAPRLSSAHSQTSIPSRNAGSGHPYIPPSASQTSLSSVHPSVHRSKSGLERAEAAYLGLDLAEMVNPLSPPIPPTFGSPPASQARARDSFGSTMSPEEIRARAEAAMAEKAAHEGR